ncbi:MAG: response regulator [Alistipes sp.]|nr:response regulator [Alistipes sp.]
MRRVIIYSGSAEFRALIEALLADESLVITKSTSRKELFELCSNDHFDFVLTDDFRMFMGDERATKRIRQADRSPEIIVFSYDTSEESVVALLEMGVNQFITLPLAPKRLRRKILGHK